MKEGKELLNDLREVTLVHLKHKNLSVKEFLGAAASYLTYAIHMCDLKSYADKPEMIKSLLAEVQKIALLNHENAQQEKDNAREHGVI